MAQRLRAGRVCTNSLLQRSGDLVSRVIVGFGSTLSGVIIVIALLITLLTKSHEP